MSAELKVFVDWNNDSLFSGTYDDITADIRSVSWNLGFRNLWQPIADESRCAISLDNIDGKYLPENANSPIFGLMNPQRRIKIAYRSNGVDTPLWLGWISEINATWRPGVTLLPVRINGVGLKNILQNETVLIPIFQDVTGDEIINEVLDQVQPPPATAGVFRLDDPITGILDSTAFLGSTDDFSDIETGITLIPTFGDQMATNALEIIRQITTSEQGRFFVARDGRATWWNRHHQLLATTDDAIVNTQVGDFQPFDLNYEYGKSIANRIRINLNPRNVALADETLWELDTTITVPPSDEVRIDATLRKANGQFAGASALNATPTFSSGTALVTVIPRGGTADILINNASIINPAVLTGLTLTGKPSLAQNQMQIEATDSESITSYGEKELSINLGVLSDVNGAQDVALFELGRRSTPTGNVREISYFNQFDGFDNSHMLSWEIGTRLNLIVDEFEHDKSYFVIGENHSWSPKQALHKATFNLEPVSQKPIMILDDAVFGILDANYLGY